MIYLDNAATTKMFEDAVDIYKNYACNFFYNPSAGYKQAIEVSKLLNEARQTIKNMLGVQNGDVIFTGGATESNNLAIKGSERNGKWEYVFSAGEHPSVYNCALALREQGATVHFVPLSANGEIDYGKLQEVLNPRTRLVSCILVSNETGAINDVQKIAALRDRLAPNALLHCDGVQALGKIDLKEIGHLFDLFTFSGHKIHGPKGVGGLYVKNKQSLKNIVYGGGQEFGKRSGTENVPAICALKYAIEKIDVEANFKKTTSLKNAFLQQIAGKRGVSYIDGKSPYILSLSFEGVNGETLMRALEDRVIISTGSACSSKSAGNRILQQIGLNPQRIKSSVRVSFNAYQTEEEVKRAAQIILQTYYEIWEKVK